MATLPLKLHSLAISRAVAFAVKRRWTILRTCRCGNGMRGSMYVRRPLVLCTYAVMPVDFSSSSSQPSGSGMPLVLLFAWYETDQFKTTNCTFEQWKWMYCVSLRCIDAIRGQMEYLPPRTFGIVIIVQLVRRFAYFGHLSLPLLMHAPQQ